MSHSWLLIGGIDFWGVGCPLADLPFKIPRSCHAFSHAALKSRKNSVNIHTITLFSSKSNSQNAQRRWKHTRQGESVVALPFYQHEFSCTVPVDYFPTCSALFSGSFLGQAQSHTLIFYILPSKTAPKAHLTHEEHQAKHCVSVTPLNCEHMWGL